MRKCDSNNIFCIFFRSGSIAKDLELEESKSQSSFAGDVLSIGREGCLKKALESLEKAKELNKLLPLIVKGYKKDKGRIEMKLEREKVGKEGKENSLKGGTAGTLSAKEKEKEKDVLWNATEV